MLISFFYSEKHPPTQISQFVLIPPTHHPKMNNFNRKKTARLKSIILFRSKAKKKLI